MGEPVSLSSNGGFRFAEETLRLLERLPASRFVETSDLVLVLTPDGLVRDAAIHDPDLRRRIGSRWFDLPLHDVVTVESREKVRRLLATAPGDPLAWVEINHPLDDGELPVRYAALRAEAGAPLVVLGRDLGGVARLQRQLVDANLSVERDYALFRSAETQARLLFQTSSEPMLIVDAASRRVAEVNPAAEDLLRRTGRRLGGSPLDEVFADVDLPAVLDCLAVVKANGQGRWPSAALRRGDVAVSGAGWLMRTAGPAQILLRLSPLGTSAAPVADPWEALRHLPEPMLAASGALDILDANEAFLDLVEVATVDQIRSEALSRFVGRHGVDLDVLSTRLHEAGSIRRYPTVLRGQYGTAHEVDVSAATVDREDDRVHAFVFRPVLAEPKAAAGDVRKPLRPVSEMTDLVGRVPLRDIVREATDIIEELCIEAALDVTQDNRASAAEMLGLSRQSLYSKLRRYGLGDLPGDGANGD